jgi:hypothetical protein
MNKIAITATASLFALAGVAQADDLLIVDLSVVNQVTLTATSGASAITASGGDSIGVYLDNFYGGAGDSLSATLISGDLTDTGSPSDGTPSLFRGGAGSDSGLNFWSWSSDSTVNFTAGQQAFVGSATWSLDANEYADMLAGSSSGNIYFPADTFDDIAGAGVLGTYRVIVPAPAALPMLGLGLGAAALRRRR